MRPILTLLVALFWCAAVPPLAFAACLAEIRARGEQRPPGIRYASFVGGAATGFTVLPWREQVLPCSEPTFPSQMADDTHARHVQRQDPGIQRRSPDSFR